MDFTKAQKLLKELKNSKFIPYYNVKIINLKFEKETLINEIINDYKKYVDEIMNEKPSYDQEKSEQKSSHYKSPYVLTLLNIVNRIFRIMLAYL